jgi:hypothetical protein
MNDFAFQETELTTRYILGQLRAHGWTFKSGAAVCGLCGGVIAPVVGAILTALAWITGPEWHGHLLQRDATILLFLTIPLLILGAHCLDLLDERDPSESAGSK